MTVVFTAVSAEWIVAAADSAVTLDFSDHREYETGRKFWAIPGVGSLSTWGARDGNLIGRKLDMEWARPEGRSVEELAGAAHAYLTNEFQPREHALGDAGYHVAGFMPDGTPRLFHSYFQSPSESGREPFYDFQDIAIAPGVKQFLYNGRNDLAHTLISLVLDELRAGRATRLRVDSVAEACFLAHFVLRIAAEITPEVGPPFLLRVLLPSGGARTLRYETMDRVPLEVFEKDLAELGAA